MHVRVAYFDDLVALRDGVAAAAVVGLDAEPGVARVRRARRARAPEAVPADHQHRVAEPRLAPVHCNIHSLLPKLHTQITPCNAPKMFTLSKNYLLIINKTQFFFVQKYFLFPIQIV